jgi:uracil-DNA glycosylase
MTIQEYFGDWSTIVDLQEADRILKKLSASNCIICPNIGSIFKAFRLCQFHNLKVVILGQDPYPQKGVATGVLFGNKAGTTELSPSLEVIKEACINYEVPHPPISFDITLESWARQGILMINSALTCEMNKVGSHVMIWRPFIKELIKRISEYNPGTIFVLFGSQAQTFEPYISKFCHVIKVQHPAYYARTNQRMPNELFTQINTLVEKMYGEHISWFTYLLT